MNIAKSNLTIIIGDSRRICCIDCCNRTNGTDETNRMNKAEVMHKANKTDRTY